jgi:hypothetical protein
MSAEFVALLRVLVTDEAIVKRGTRVASAPNNIIVSFTLLVPVGKF